MNKEHLLKVVGFFAGLDYHSEMKSSDGETDITNGCIVYLLANVCDRNALKEIMEFLEQRDYLAMSHNYLDSKEEVVGYLNGWIKESIDELWNLQMKRL
jgi:hypothetical protein